MDLSYSNKPFLFGGMALLVALGFLIGSRISGDESTSSKLDVRAVDSYMPGPHIIDLMAAQSPGELADLALTVEDLKLRRSMREVVEKKMLAMDYQDAWSVMKLHSEGFKYSNAKKIVRSIFSKWVSDAPGEAGDEAAKNAGYHEASAFAVIAEQWARKDPRGFYEWVPKYHDSLSGDADVVLFTTAGRSFAEEAPNEALNYIDSAFRILETNLDDTPEALSIVSMVDFFLTERNKDFERWLRKDPNRADLLKISDYDVLALFVAKSPELLLELAEENAFIRKGNTKMFSDEDGLTCIPAAIKNISKYDKKLAFSMIEKWASDDVSYSNIMLGLSSFWFQEYGKDGALKLLGEFEGEGGPSSVKLLAEIAPGEAAEVLEGQILSADLSEHGKGANSAMLSVALRFAEEDPVKASVWVESLPESLSKDLSIGLVVEGWTEIDPQAAADWVARMPVSQGRDVATKRLVKGLTSENPALALEWARHLSKGARKSAELRIFRSWLRSDPLEGKKQVLGSDLSEELKSRLLPHVRK